MTLATWNGNIKLCLPLSLDTEEYENQVQDDHSQHF